MTSPGAVSSSGSTPTTPMMTPQRLQSRQSLIDAWTTWERLSLASTVQRSGLDPNWVSVSRQMRQFAEPHRPADWFSQKNCALQYNIMLEKIEKEMPPSTGRRKRGNSDANNSSADDHNNPGAAGNNDPGRPANPADLIVKKLEMERMKVEWTPFNSSLPEPTLLSFRGPDLLNDDVKYFS